MNGIALRLYISMLVRSLSQMDNSQANLEKDDLDILIDMALEIGDKEWFMDLSSRYKAHVG